MKHLFTGLLLLIPLFVLKAQDEIYYQPENVLPTLRKPNRKQALKQLETIRIRSRWYLGTDHYGRLDKTTLDNHHDYLLRPASTWDYSFSGQIGWIFREQLAIEGGYAHTGIHNNARLNTTNKGGFRFTNNRNAIFLRTKVLLEFEKPGLRRPGLWLGAGGWAVPNSGGTREPKGFKIFHYNGYGNPADTTYVGSATTISNDWTFGLEASAEYSFKAAEWADIAFFLRHQWGYGNAITTELTYSDNHDILGKGYLQSNGTGWSFGISLRFVSAIQRGAVREKTENSILQAAPAEIIIQR